MGASKKTQDVVQLWNQTQTVEIETHIRKNYAVNNTALNVINGKEIDASEYKHLCYMADYRSIEELLEETVRAWIIEDIVLTKLDDAELNGSDAKRVFASSTANVTTDPDICADGENVEVVADYGGYWIKNKSLEMRSNKFENMSNDTIIIGVDVKNKQMFKIKKKNIVDYQYIDSYGPFGGKSVYSINLENVNFESID